MYISNHNREVYTIHRVNVEFSTYRGQKSFPPVHRSWNLDPKLVPRCPERPRFGVQERWNGMTKNSKEYDFYVTFRVDTIHFCLYIIKHSPFRTLGTFKILIFIIVSYIEMDILWYFILTFSTRTVATIIFDNVYISYSLLSIILLSILNNNSRNTTHHKTQEMVH